MSTPVELESMIVRLLGDGSSYMRMLKDAVGSTASTVAAIGQQTAKIEDFQKSVEGFGKATLTAFAASGVKDYVGSAFNMFSETETAVIRLTAAVKASGAEVGTTVEGYKAFAKALYQSTGASSNETFALLRKAEVMGFSGTAAQDAVRTAYALAAAWNTDAESTLRVAKAMQDGNWHMVHHIADLRGLKTDSEKLAKAQKDVGIGIQTAADLMNSSAGAVKQYEGVVKGLTKQFGQLVAEVLTPLIKSKTEFLKLFLDLDMDTKKVIVTLGLFAASVLSVGPMFQAFQKLALPVLASMGAGLTLLGNAFMLLLNPMRMVSLLLSGIGFLVSAVFSPIGLAIIAVTAITAFWVNEVGGLSEAWLLVKQYALDAWQWIKVTGLEAWDAVREKILAVVEWLKPYMDTATKVMRLAWQTIKEYIVLAYEALLPYVDTLKAMAIGVGILIGGFLAVKAVIYLVSVAFAVAGGTFNFFFGGVGIMLGALIASGAGIASLLASMGGLAATWQKVSDAAVKAWTWVKQAVKDFVVWSLPILLAWYGAAKAHFENLAAVAVIAWEGIKVGAVWLWEAVVQAFNWAVEQIGQGWLAITGGAEVSWKDVQRWAMTAFIAIEFGFRNIVDIAKWAWAGAQYYAVSYFNEVTHFFTSTIPTVFVWFRQNSLTIMLGVVVGMWKLFQGLQNNLMIVAKDINDAFIDILWMGIREGALNSIQSIVEGFKAIPRLVQAALSGGNIAGELRRMLLGDLNDSRSSIIRQLQDLPNIINGAFALTPLRIPPRAVGELEEQLRREFEAQGAALAGAWPEFLRRRMDEINAQLAGGITLPENIAKVLSKFKDKAAAAGTAGGQSLTQAFKEAVKIDAVLFNSVEALARVLANSKRVLIGETFTAGNALSPGTGQPGTAINQPIGSPTPIGGQSGGTGDDASRREIVDAIKALGTLLASIRDKDPVVINTLGLI